MGQSWDFLRSVSVHFGSPSQIVLKLPKQAKTVTDTQGRGQGEQLGLFNDWLI